jgi:hypothetical protein
VEEREWRCACSSTLSRGRHRGIKVDEAFFGDGRVESAAVNVLVGKLCEAREVWLVKMRTSAIEGRVPD